MKKKKSNILLGPVITMIILTLIIILLSALLSSFNVKGEITKIINGSMETYTVAIKSIFSKQGLIYFFSQPVNNFKIFEPLVLIILSLITVSIGKTSGLFKILFSPLRRIKPSIITFITLLLSILSTMVGDYGYIFLIPLIAIMYETIGRNSVLGVITCFIGITAGYASGIGANYTDLVLGNLTQKAATISVDANYKFSLSSISYIMPITMLILSLIGTRIIETFLVPKIKESVKEKDESLVSKKGFLITIIVFVFMMLGVIYSIIDGLPGSGMLLNQNATNYLSKLFSPTAPFNSAFAFIILIIFMVCGGIYGFISKNITNTNQYSVGLSSAFSNLGYMFVLMFFASTTISILDWTNLGQVLGTNLINFVGSLEFSGISLIIITFVAIVLMAILMPATIIKWKIASPILVPLFMKSNITPDFTQFVFTAADSVGKGLTPFFVYFIITLAFIEKYNNNEKTKVTVFGVLKNIMPTILMFGVVWLLIIVGWYVVGLPLGHNIYPTM